jgi:hypothetical protein
MPRGHRIPRTTEETELRDNWKKRKRITVTCAQLPCDGAEEVWVPHQRWPTYLRGLMVGAFVRELPPHLHARISRASNKDPDLNAKRAKDSGTNAKNKGTDKLHQGYVEAQRVCYCHLDGVYQRAQRRQELGLAADAPLPDAEQEKFYPDCGPHPREATIIAEKQNDARFPSFDTVRDRTRAWAHSQFQIGHHLDVPSHVEGDKMAKHRHHYENLRALLLAGWVDDKGKRHAFRSLEDLERRDAARRAADMAKPEADRDKELADSPSFARIKQDLCVSMRTMWHNLHSLYPKLRKMRQRYKRIRKDKAAVVVRSSSSCTAQSHCSHACSHTQCMQLQFSRMSVPLRLCGSPWHAPAPRHCSQSAQQHAFISYLCMQDAASQILGKQPMSFNENWKLDLECYWACRDAGIFGEQDWWWCHHRGFKQWFVDAFTIDPAAILKNDEVIWEEGVEQPVEESNLANAGPGDAPKVSAFLATHPVHGTFVFFPKTSNRGGPAGSFNGFEYCWDKATEDDIKLLRSQGYYNRTSVTDSAAFAQELSELDRKNGVQFEGVMFKVHTLHQFVTTCHAFAVPCASCHRF